MTVQVFTIDRKLVSATPEWLSNAENIKTVRIAVGIEPQEAIHDLEFMAISWNSHSLGICFRELEFFSQPRKQSENSQAIYLAQFRKPGYGLLLQYLAPESVTSRHYHKITTEYFHPLNGHSKIEIDGLVSDLSGTLAVVTFRPHQLWTDEQPALNIIEMIGHPEGISMDDHYYMPRDSIGHLD